MRAAGGGTEHIYGTTAQAAITFPAGDRTLGVRLSYLKEIKGIKSNLIGAGVFFVL